MDNIVNNKFSQITAENSAIVKKIDSELVATI